jgi:hypothetical protein
MLKCLTRHRSERAIDEIRELTGEISTKAFGWSVRQSFNQTPDKFRPQGFPH